MNVAALSEENAKLKAHLAHRRRLPSIRRLWLSQRRRAVGPETIVSDFRHEKYGAKSEKLTPDQYNLPLEDVEVAQGVLDAAQEKGRGRDQGQIPRPLLFWQPQSWSAARASAARGTGGRAKPKSILCPCGCGEMTKIGEDVSQRLDVIGAL
jgi:hypothetical protein